LCNSSRARSRQEKIVLLVKGRGLRWETARAQEAKSPESDWCGKTETKIRSELNLIAQHPTSVGIDLNLVEGPRRGDGPD